VLRDLYHAGYDQAATYYVPTDRKDHTFPKWPLPLGIFFTRGAQTSSGNQGQYRGWWGKITKAKVGTPSRERPDQPVPTWLHLDGRRPSIAVCLPPQLAKSYGLDDRRTVERIEGVYLIALGEYRISASGNHYIALPARDPASHLHLDVARTLAR
jgi:hypothetical protein